MPSLTYSYQLRKCPESFQERLTKIGGINRYGLPNFRIVWGQGGERDCYYRAGGAWHVEGLPSYVGYRDLLIGGGTPSWCLLQWKPPEHYGTPEMWYIQNLDPETNLQTLGQFPYSGKYELLYNLRWTEKRGDRLIFEAMPLNSLLLEMIVPIIIAAKDISYEKTKAALKDIELREQERDLSMIEDVMRSNALPFKGSPVSYGKQGCRTALVDKKIEIMQRNWVKMMTNAKSLGRGLSQRSTNSAGQ